jgi:trigger factor
MNITQNNIDELNAEIVLSFQPEDYSEQYETALLATRKNANMPGFRPGKVPMGMVKKMHGKAILAEEFNKMINEKMQGFIVENKLQVLGNPLPKEMDRNGDWENPGEFEFIFELGLAPQFELALNDKEKYEYSTIKIDDDLLNKEMDNLTRRYGQLTEAEKSEDNDLLVGDFVQLDENNEILEAGIMKEGTIALEYLTDDEVKAGLIGRAVGEIAVVDPSKVSRGADDMAQMLGISIDEVGDMKSMFNFRVGEVKRMNPAELNQELFDKLFGEGNVNSEEELRKRLGEDMTNMFKRDTDRVFMNQVTERLIETAGISLPDEFLKRWIMQSNDKPITVEQVDAEYDQYSKGLKWQLIENKIITTNELKVEDQEAIDYAKGMLAAQWKQYGLPDPADDELTEQATKMMSNQEEGKRVYDMLYDQKVMQYVKETVKLENKELSYDDFVKLASGGQN